MKVFNLKKKYDNIEFEPIESNVVEPTPQPVEMSIYDAWRSGHITLEKYQSWIKDGYPKTLPIKI